MRAVKCDENCFTMDFFFLTSVRQGSTCSWLFFSFYQHISVVWITCSPQEHSTYCTTDNTAAMSKATLKCSYHIEESRQNNLESMIMVMHPCKRHTGGKTYILKTETERLCITSPGIQQGSYCYSIDKSSPY